MNLESINLKKLTDSELIASADRSIKQEREATTLVIHHFREIERRRLFSAHKFGSLFEMAVRHFGYTEDQANARISAMRLLKELPELEEKIAAGSLTLTHLNLARTHFRNEKKHGQREATRDEMLDLVLQLENTSKREAQVLLQTASSRPIDVPHDEIKPLGEDKIVLKFAAAAQLEAQVKVLKGLLAHKHPELSLGELFQKLCELGLQEWSPAKEPKRKRKSSRAAQNLMVAFAPGPERGAAGQVAASDNEAAQEERTGAGWPSGAGAREDGSRTHDEFSQAAIHRHIWKRDQSKCTNCKSTFAPEKDHRIPKAKGGDDSTENLRLLCKSCNQRAAIEAFGLELMDQYLN
ncbi:MAG TPA: HNH endonuclease signature motif containing protein [Bdellovibrionales bacterium]|nr:HNH endonuclease signature motif containing protein [Bdellovibrionales bacterium]